MREYLDSIFQKAKKPLTIDEIFHAVEYQNGQSFHPGYNIHSQ